MEFLKTLLIANRGEIAVRIIKTAKYVVLSNAFLPFLHTACFGPNGSILPS